MAKAWPPEGPPVVWQRPVGQGYSGPVVSDDRLILHHRVGARTLVECLEAPTGLADVRDANTKMDVGEPRFSTGGVCPPVATKHVPWSWPGFAVEGLRRRCATNTETTAVKPRVGIERLPRGV
jgi:hypothetical protein